MSRWEIRIATVIGVMVLGLTPPATTAVEQPGLAIATLETLPVKGRAPKTGYTRDQFGQAWADIDRNGCDTRNDILKRDLTSITNGSAKKPHTGQANSGSRRLATIHT